MSKVPEYQPALPGIPQRVVRNPRQPKSPMTKLAWTFMMTFRPQIKFGPKVVERQLGQVMEEGGFTPRQMYARIRAWGDHRNNMRPWDLLENPPEPLAADLPEEATQKANEIPTDEAPLEAVSELVKRTQTPYEGEDI